MLAEVAARLGRDDDASTLLERCLELAPSFTPRATTTRCCCTGATTRPVRLPVIERLLAAEPRNPGYRNFHAVLLSRLGEYERASRIYAELLREYPSHAKVWLSYGHTLKTVGRQDEGVAAYRRSIALEPAFGEAYWSLANLKTFRFEPAEIAAMEAKARGSRGRRRGPPAPPLRARQGLRGRGRLGAVVRALREGQCAAPRAPPLRRGRQHRRACSTCRRRSRANSSPRAPAPAARRPTRSSSSACRARARRCSSRSSRATAGRRARWSCPRSSRMARELRARVRIAGSRRLYRRAGLAWMPPKLRELGERYHRADARPPQDRTARSSSTRCRTTSCTSG